MMFGRKARRIFDLHSSAIMHSLSIADLRDCVEHLEKLVNVGTTRLDLHAQRLGALEDDVENLK